jgi:PAS domain S-box-containing protein
VPVHVWIFILVASVVLGFLLYDLRAAYHDTLTYWDSNLSNSADEQTSIETLWLLERRTDTEAVAINSATLRMLSQEVGVRQRAGIQREVELAIERIAHINGFLGGAVADAECRILAQVGVPAEAGEGVQRVCRRVQATRAYSVVASYPGPARLLVNMAVPVSAGEGVSTGSQTPRLLVGVAIMISEPREAVSRFFAERSRPDQFAETEIIWPNQGEAVGFTPQPNALGMGSLFRQPLSGNTFESRAARARYEEFGEFTDYRGVRVFGVARPIGAVGATLARKVDKDQALANFHKRALLEWLAAALSLLLFGSVILIQHRHQAMRDLQEKLRQQQTLLDLKRHVEASEERYRAFVANSTEAIWRMETEKPISTALPVGEQIGQVLQHTYLAECNDSMARMFGFEHASELIGLRLKNLALIGPRTLGNLETFIRSGYRLADAESAAQDRQGKLHHFLNTYLGVVEGGYLLRAWGVLRDVTERKRVEEALRESERRYRVLFETAGIGIALVDMQGRLIKANPALQRMLGYDEEELRQMLFTEFTHPDDRQRDWELYQELLAGKIEKYEIEKRHIRKDGQVVWGQMTGSLVRGADGQPVYGVGMVEDITERKQAVEALRASETQLRTLMQRAPVAISISRSGRTLYVNQAYLDMYGFQSAEEVIGHSLGEQWSPEYRAMVEEFARQRALGLPVPTRYEAVGQRRDGSQFPVELAVARVELSDGQASVSFLTDITERKRADTELVDRLRFETLLADLSARFVDVEAGDWGKRCKAPCVPSANA